VHLVGFTIEIYHDARSHERQICLVSNSVASVAKVIFLPCSLAVYAVEYTLSSSPSLMTFPFLLRKAIALQILEFCFK